MPNVHYPSYPSWWWSCSHLDQHISQTDTTQTGGNVNVMTKKNSTLIQVRRPLPPLNLCVLCNNMNNLTLISTFFFNWISLLRVLPVEPFFRWFCRWAASLFARADCDEVDMVCCVITPNWPHSVPFFSDTSGLILCGCFGEECALFRSSLSSPWCTLGNIVLIILY